MNGTAIVPLQHMGRVDEVGVGVGVSSNLPFAGTEAAGVAE